MKRDRYERLFNTLRTCVAQSELDTPEQFAVLNGLNETELIFYDTLDDSDFLSCLKACGVDNWVGYGDAQEMCFEEE